jgi:hypothetical protein
VNEKKIGDMTDEELAFLLSTTPPGPLAEQLKVDLQLRMGKRQTESADARVVATKGLVAATSRLAWATWASYRDPRGEHSVRDGHWRRALMARHGDGKPARPFSRARPASAGL